MMVRVYWPQPCAVCCPYAALTPSNGVKCYARADGDGPAVFFSARAALTALRSRPPAPRRVPLRRLGYDHTICYSR